MLNCKYCGKECHNLNSLRQHEIRCKANPERKAFNSLANYSHNNFKGQTKDTNEVIAKQAAKLKQLYNDGILTSPSKGKPGTFLGRKGSTPPKNSNQEREKSSRFTIENDEIHHLVGLNW